MGAMDRDVAVTEVERTPLMPAVGGSVASGPTYQLLPFYVVCDESDSMRHEIDALNQAMDRIHAKLVAEPKVCDVARLSMIAFSDTAEVVLPLTDLTSLTGLPDLSARSSTSYAAAFDRLGETINADVPAAKNAGYKVLRPAVFVLTDGMPTDPENVWQVAWDRLLDGPYRPNVISFGFRDAEENVLEHIATLQAYIAEQTGPAEAISKWAKHLVDSVVAFSQQAGREQPTAGPVLPEAPTGTRALFDPV